MEGHLASPPGGGVSPEPRTTFPNPSEKKVVHSNIGARVKKVTKEVKVPGEAAEAVLLVEVIHIHTFKDHMAFVDVDHPYAIMNNITHGIESYEDSDLLAFTTVDTLLDTPLCFTDALKHTRTHGGV